MKLKAACLILTLFTVGACTTNQDTLPQTLICPQVAIVRSLQEITSFTADKPQTKENSQAAARLVKVQGQCSWREPELDEQDEPLPKTSGIDVNFRLNLEAIAGPAYEKGESFAPPYFAAVLNGTNAIMSKATFKTEFALVKGAPLMRKQEELHIFIPEEKIEHTKDYRVLLGFEKKPTP